ncbi:YfdQ family protein [Microbulbifer sp. OS29]|uniref:YfdQ family protein n=1 Tax=Microbulbifer okhotskensis TaxID=2926617 RepID=A0A9X2ERV3_9GAMM|nr:DUF2303 family protein [Microbulbifer okhotskensis]MCO1336640.1 YfdQ family protein [Microbulbifer okhotskensis]
MTMDQSAVKEIQKSQAIATIDAAIHGKQLEKPVLAAPADFKLHNLEGYLPGRTRFRGAMRTIVLLDFISYSLDHRKDNDSACFVDPASMSAETIFNLGTDAKPGHADFSAKVNLVKTAEYKALLDINGHKLSQKQLAEFLEDYAENIVCYSPAGEVIPITEAVAAVRRLTIESSRKEDYEVQEFKSSRSDLENIEARSEKVLPAGFKFECTPYNDLSLRTFDLRLSVITGREAPALSVRIKRLESVQEDMGRELETKLSDAFSAEDTSEQKIETYIGSFSP